MYADLSAFQDRQISQVLSISEVVGLNPTLDITFCSFDCAADKKTDRKDQCYIYFRKKGPRKL